MPLIPKVRSTMFLYKRPKNGRGVCQCCGRKTKLTKHHIVPQSENGANNIVNYEWICRPCHDLKHNMVKKSKTIQNTTMQVSEVKPDG